MRLQFRIKPQTTAVLACFVAFTAGSVAHAQISVTPGTAGTWPVQFLPIGPLDTDLGNNSLSVGGALNGPGTLSVAGGSVLRAAALYLGNEGTGGGNALLSGIGSRIELTGNIPRLTVGAFGTGSLTMSQGATLDASLNPSSCIGAGNYCGSGVAGYAGSTGSFTLTGLGTSANFISNFVVTSTQVSNPLVDGYTAGTPGATSQGRINILDGAVLRTQVTQLTTAPNGNGALGTERSFADVVIRGTGSTWILGQSTLDGGPALLTTGNGPNSWTTITISDGGKLRMEGSNSRFNNINLTNGLGRTDVTVTGAGSRLEMTGSNTALAVGNSLGTSNMQVLAGAVVDGPLNTTVGAGGSRGTLVLDGAGTRFSLYGIGQAGTSSAGFSPTMTIGRAANSNGTVTVSNAAVLDISSTGATVTQSPVLLLGTAAASASGSLNITGANSVVSLSAASVLAGGGAGEALNPAVLIGADGSGFLNITAGGKLLVNGGAVSTLAASRLTVLFVGGRNDTTGNGIGVAKVSGAGSEIRLTGSDTSVIVGFGPLSSGQLALSAGASLASTVLAVGRNGNGNLNADNAQINLAGQFASLTQTGAAFVVGDGSTGNGIANLSNGARLTISNPTGTNGTGVTIGGSLSRAGGNGIFNMSGGSALQINAPADLAGMTVGRSGTGVANISGSSIDLSGGSLYIGRLAGAVGTMSITNTSTVTAGYVGVGRTQTGNGGTGTLIVNSSSMLTATTI